MAAAHNLLATRSLNALRKLHLPTYVASRFLFQSVAGNGESGWSNTVSLRKYPLRQGPGFHLAPKFKKIHEVDGTIVYRDFHVPSPTMSLAEAVVLSRLASAPTFAKPWNVYSYRWPTDPRYPYNYEHYSRGYRERNIQIAGRVAASSDEVVLVSDIERFYPSINHRAVKERLNHALRSGSVAEETADLARALCDDLLSVGQGGVGIATGPEISHLFGDLALRKVDAELTQRFPSSYFRYVDDIVLVVRKADVDGAIRLLMQLLQEEGLTMHPDKTDVVPAVEWLKHGPHNFQDVQETSFESLIFRIKAFLLMHPEEERELAKALEGEGISIPLSRLATISGSKSFAARFKRFWRRRWWVAITAAVASIGDVVAEAIAVREAVSRELKDRLSLPISDGGTRRRWYVQRLRYLVNRSMYLRPIESLSFLIDALRPFPEFVESVALLRLFLQNDPMPLISMPGSAVVTAAAKLKEQAKTLAIPDNQQLKNIAFVESLGVLEIFGVVKVPNQYMDTLDDDRRMFFEFCSGTRNLRRVRHDFGYLDEITSLQLHRSKEEIVSMTETRFSDQEASILDALDMGGEQSS